MLHPVYLFGELEPNEKKIILKVMKMNSKNSCPDVGYLVGKTNGEIIWVCPNVKSFSGFEYHEIYNAPPSYFIHPEDAEFMPAIRERYHTEKKVGFLIRILNRNNTYYWIKFTVYPCVESSRIHCLLERVKVPLFNFNKWENISSKKTMSF